MKGHQEGLIITATAPGAGGAAGVAVAGDSLIVKNAKGSARILALWGYQQGAGFGQLTAPSMHDQTRGYRYRVAPSDLDIRIPMGEAIEVQPQEQLALTIAGSAVAGDIEAHCFAMYYEGLGGVSDGSRAIGYAEMRRRQIDLVTIDATITTTATPGITGEELITAESDLLKANTDYAILGAICTVECAALSIRGPDTGNVKVIMPGNDVDVDMMAGWFSLLARAHDLPLIPVINSGNRGSTYIGAAQNENAAAVPVSWILARLKS